MVNTDQAREGCWDGFRDLAAYSNPYMDGYEHDEYKKGYEYGYGRKYEQEQSECGQDRL